MPTAYTERTTISQQRQAVIIQPGDLAAVMSTTPLLAALSRAQPDMAIDWVVGDAARPAINGNPRLRRLISMGNGGEGDEWSAWLRAGRYDICFIPEPVRDLAFRAQRARIPTRVGFGNITTGLLLSKRVRVPAGSQKPGERYLALAAAAGVDPAIIETAEMEFYPSDYDRADVTRWLVESMDWLGDTPLVALHPGIGVPDESLRERQWPAERFARLANHLIRAFGARVVLVGGPQDVTVGREVAGMLSVPVANRTGQMGLGEMGALCELANLYIGNDAGPAYIAAAAGCPTVVIHGPTDPAVSGPYMINTPVTSVWRSGGVPFSWKSGATVEDAIEALTPLLAPQP